MIVCVVCLYIYICMSLVVSLSVRSRDCVLGVDVGCDTLLASDSAGYWDREATASTWTQRIINK